MEFLRFSATPHGHVLASCMRRLQYKSDDCLQMNVVHLRAVAERHVVTTRALFTSLVCLQALLEVKEGAKTGGFGGG